MPIGFPWMNNQTIITLNDFLLNPAGRKTSYGAKRENIINDLKRRYDEILKKTNGVLKYDVYSDHGKFDFVFRIPSETFDNLLYDVVLEFNPQNKADADSSSLIDYTMTFFSNSPHMTFTYTYVLNKENLIVDFVKKYKCSKVALTQKPRVTNPVEQFGFEKTCYFAALYIKNKKLYEKSNLKNAIIPDKNTTVQVLNTISTQDAKFLQYNTLKQEEADKKKKEKNEAVRKANNKKVEAASKKSSAKRNISYKYKGKKTFNSVFKKKK
jgi:hypothetical protein